MTVLLEVAKFEGDGASEAEAEGKAEPEGIREDEVEKDLELLWLRE